MSAACPEPIPGRKEEKGVEIRDPRKDCLRSFFEILRSLREIKTCFGILGLFCMEVIRADIPKRPERRGRSG